MENREEISEDAEREPVSGQRRGSGMHSAGTSLRVAVQTAESSYDYDKHQDRNVRSLSALGLLTKYLKCGFEFSDLIRRQCFVEGRGKSFSYAGRTWLLTCVLVANLFPRI